MRGAYLDYAMSVIIGRALPDVRDGLKPVHRRVLYAMYDLNNTHDKPYKKSARVVGDVIGKYHPHGDSAVYDAIVRMAQDFSLREPLVDGQGNFGSIDGDAAAAMRYTEIRMSKITAELLADLDRDTVDFGPNYDETLKEPLVFPAKFPNLLVNGSTGIAVGMATNIPPHNLGEVIDASVALIHDPGLQTDALLHFVKGPDFPTAGVIFGGAGLKKAYLTGRGSVTMRGKAEIETSTGDRERIVISELPYNVNKAKLIEKIADLVRDKKIEGISDLRDESDRTGMRVVVDIKKGEASSVILNNLFKLTQLQENFSYSLLAIHENQPKIFNLRDMLWAFIEHRKDVVLRRTAHDLKKARARAHILEGLKRAVESLDPVIQLIRSAKTPDEAKDGLMKKFQFSDLQAQAILDMRLQRLTGLERDKIVADYKDVMAQIEELRKILSSEALVFEIIEKELLDIKEQHATPRKTEVSNETAEDFEVEDLIADEEVLVTITHRGFIKRVDPSQFRAQGRGGRGIQGAAKTDEEDFVASIYTTTLHSYLLCFTDKGRVYWLKVYKVPEVSRTGRGKAIVNLINLGPGEKVVAVLPVREFNSESEYIFFVTKQGVVKKTPVSAFKNIRSAGIAAIAFEAGDQLLGARVTDGNKDVFLVSKDGMSIRFNEEDVRPMGRSAKGVGGMGLEDGDAVIAMEVLHREGSDTVKGVSEILMVTEFGFGKRTPAGEYRLQSRYGKGILSMKTTDRNGPVAAVCQVGQNQEVMIVSSQGKIIRLRVNDISELGRVTQGVKVMNLTDGEKVVALSVVADANSPEPTTT